MKSLKRDKICPQCQHRKLWHVDKIRAFRSDSGTPAALAVAVEGSIWGGFHQHGSFEAFICARCGFTEWYAQGLGELQPDRINGIQFIDAEPKAGLR